MNAGEQIEVHVTFFSYFKEMVGQPDLSEKVPPGTTLGQMFDSLTDRFPKLGAMSRCTLMAVGVEYAGRDYVLKAGDQVSFFPPVQGG